MVMASTALPHEQDFWTIEDLARMPEDERRYEIVDGQLVMMSRVSLAHQRAVACLRDVLREAFGDGFCVWENVAVNIAPTWRVPDLTVFGASAYTAAGLDVLPADIALIVEVVSPGSRTNDRITKPAEYAAASIKAYWRIETQPTVSLTACTLADGATTYTELSTWGKGETAVIADPVDVRVDIDALMP